MCPFCTSPDFDSAKMTGLMVRSSFMAVVDGLDHISLKNVEMMVEIVNKKSKTNDGEVHTYRVRMFDCY